jgi:hypothetical protein
LSLATTGAAPYQTLSLQSPDSVDVTKNGHQRARVLYDYDAKDATELSLMADEVTQPHPLGFLYSWECDHHHSSFVFRTSVTLTECCYCWDKDWNNIALFSIEHGLAWCFILRKELWWSD